MVSEAVSTLLAAAAEFAARERLGVFLVGGSVRRLVTDQAMQDLDMVVDAPKGALRLGEALATRIEGCSGPAVISSFPTVELRCGGLVVQIGETIPHVTMDLSGTDAALSEPLRQDALRRDFTANTLLVPVQTPTAESVVDPLGRGRLDLREKLLRTPKAPRDTLSDDPLRMLRAVRFCVTEGFLLDPDLAAAIVLCAPKIIQMPGERVGQEIGKVLTSGYPSRGVRMLRELGLLAFVLPEIEELAEIEQPTEYHGDDVLSHTLKVLDGVGPEPRLRLAALFHDVAKSSTRRERDGRTVFYGHQYAGGPITRVALQRLRFPRALIEDVVELVERHMLAYRPEWSDKAVRRLVRRAGELLEPLLELYRADIAARKPPHNNLGEFEHLRGRLSEIDIELIRGFRPPLSGEDVMELLGLPPGPAVGEALRSVEGAIVDGQISPDAGAAKDFLLESFSPRRQSPSE